VQLASSEQLGSEIHASGTRLVLAATGGGSGAISALLSVPGASRSILEAAVPYAPAALVEWLGGAPDEYCSAATARAMAMAAFLRARRYDSAARTCGVSCTASLASDRPKRGPHRVHLAFQTADTTAEASVELKKGSRTRAEEEALASALLLNLAAEACGVESRLETPLVEGEQVSRKRAKGSPAEQALVEGRLEAIRFDPRSRGDGGSIVRAFPTEKPHAVLPGAFNPLHQAHRRMARVASEILGCEVAYELSILNVDKPPLDFMEIERRMQPFSTDDNVWLSRAARFSRKADIFPGATFVVGADTVARVGEVRYYGGDATAMRAAIEHLAQRHCRFLVFGRVVQGVFQNFAELRLPAELARLCQEVPEDAFRDDTSSSELRGRAKSD
jgi:nicotinamide mononucleotide (NMN) deamidase PncC